MAFVKGEERILYIKIDGVFIPVACLVSNDFQEETETLATTTRDSGGWKSSLPITQSYVIPFSGLQKTNSPVDATKNTYTDLKKLKRDRTKIEWKTEAFGKGLIDVGYGYITFLSEAASVGDALTFDGTIQGEGKPIDFIDDIPPSSPFLHPITVDGTGYDLYNILSWDSAVDNVGVVGYNIYRDGKLYDSIGDVNTYNDVAVSSPGQYSYNVSAFDLLGNEGGRSNKRFIIMPIPSGTPPNYYTFQDGQDVLFQDGKLMTL